MASTRSSPERSSRCKSDRATTYEGDVHILRALKAGAQGYLLKNTLHSELLHTIRAVHAGKKSIARGLVPGRAACERSRH